MSSRRREYQVRVAELGAPEVPGNVEFTLTISDPLPLHRVPVVAGSFVHPLDGATETRPLQIEAVDLEGALIEAFTAQGRWAGVGRLLDIRFRDLPGGAWVTYGTGRCSGLDELQGLGKFRVEISDESWVARKGEVFSGADTTSIWPAGVRERWRGFQPAHRAAGSVAATEGNLYRIELTAGGFGDGAAKTRGREITDEIRRWIIEDREPDEDQWHTGPDAELGNWRHLRLRYEDTNGDMQDWEIVSFGSNDTASVATITSPTITNPDSSEGRQVTIHAWVVWPGAPAAAPAASGDGFLYAPTAEPSDALPLHAGINDPDHPLGAELTVTSAGIEATGWLHPAEMTRLVWDELGLRYDAANLEALEEDITFPAVAPRITENPRDTEAWMQDHIWGPCMLVALKDAHGRRKLADLRPPPEGADLGDLPVLDATNARGHVWQVLGREVMNSVVWDAQWYTLPEDQSFSIYLGGFGFIQGQPATDIPAPLDGFFVRDEELGPFDDPNVEDVGLRRRRFRATSFLTDPTHFPNHYVNLVLADKGQSFDGQEPGDLPYDHSQFMLQLYRDGPMKGRGEVGREMAETLEEGDYIIVNQSALKNPNPGEAARSGGWLAILLSITRHPAHADVEYIGVRPAPIWECPVPDEPDTWWYSAPDEQSLMYVRWPELPAVPTAVTIRAHKDGEGGDQVTMVVTLEIAGDLGSDQVGEWTIESVPSEPQGYFFALTAEEAQQIADSPITDPLGSLRTHVIRTADGVTAEPDLRRLVVSDLCIQVPHTEE